MHFGHLGQAQAVGQDGLNERLVIYLVDEVDRHHGAFCREGEKPISSPPPGTASGTPVRIGRFSTGSPSSASTCRSTAYRRPEVVANAGLGRGIGHALHQGESGQVVAAAQLGELTFYGAFYCFFHFKPI